MKIDFMDLVNQMNDLYLYMDKIINKENGIVKPIVDDHFLPLCDVLDSSFQNFEYPLLNKFESIEKYDHIPSNKTKVILFSGGKVSTAMALHMKEMGENAVLFFIKNRYGLLKKVSREHEEIVKKLANKLEMQLVVHSVQLNPENPLYKFVMLNEAIAYALQNNYDINVGMGVFDGTSRFNNPVSMISNTVELRGCYEYVLQQSVEDFHVSVPIASYAHVLEKLLSNKWIIPYIYTESKLEEQLLYIWRVDHNLVEEEDQTLYMKYIHKLHMYIEKELGESVKDINRVWKRYIPYPINKSKHRKEVVDFFE